MKTFEQLIEAEAENLLSEPLLCSPQYPKEVKAGFRLGAKFVHENPTMIESVRELVDGAKLSRTAILFHGANTREDIDKFLEPLNLAIKKLGGADGK